MFIRSNRSIIGCVSHFDLSGGAVLHEETKGKSCNPLWKSAAKLFSFQTPV